MRATLVWLAIALSALPAAAQPPVITLADAQATALRNHPHIASAALTARASEFVEKEVDAAFYPVVAGNVTAVGAEHSSTLSAGALTTSSIFSRGATGIVISQLVTDFGRTSSLADSAKFRSQAQGQNVVDTRARVVIAVQQAYYQALAAESILRVVRATLELRRLTLRQISALSESALRSTLDVRFAEVAVSQAELDLFRAESAATAGHTLLSAAMGYDHDEPFALNDEPLPGALDATADPLIEQARRERPDLAALKLNQQALSRFADAEGRLRNPTVTALAAAGVAPVRDERIQETYSAAGVNLNIPVFNGGLYKARHEEAESRASAAGKDAEDLSVRIARDVKVAWLDANDAFRRLDVTTRMVNEAKEAVRLAQARYDNALGSIVELNQAQLNQTTAEIAAAAAKYEYLSRRSRLNFEIGILK